MQARTNPVWSGLIAPRVSRIVAICSLALAATGVGAGETDWLINLRASTWNWLSAGYTASIGTGLAATDGFGGEDSLIGSFGQATGYVGIYRPDWGGNPPFYLKDVRAPVAAPGQKVWDLRVWAGLAYPAATLRLAWWGNALDPPDSIGGTDYQYTVEVYDDPSGTHSGYTVTYSDLTGGSSNFPLGSLDWGAFPRWAGSLTEPIKVRVTVAPVGGAGPTPVSVAGAKRAAAGASIALSQVTVTAVFADCIYAEEADRSCGVRITGSLAGAAVGDAVDVTGATAYANHEKSISATALTRKGSASAKPLGFVSKCLGGASFGYSPATGAGQEGVAGGAGVNSVGLLVKVCGLVTQVGSGYLYLEDGSSLLDGSTTGSTPNSGLRIICDPTGYASGNRVEVVGVCSIFQTPTGRVAPRVLARGSGGLRRL